MTKKEQLQQQINAIVEKNEKEREVLLKEYDNYKNLYNGKDETKQFILVKIGKRIVNIEAYNALKCYAAFIKIYNKDNIKSTSPQLAPIKEKLKALNYHNTDINYDCFQMEIKKRCNQQDEDIRVSSSFAAFKNVTWHEKRLDEYQVNDALKYFEDNQIKEGSFSIHEVMKVAEAVQNLWDTTKKQKEQYQKNVQNLKELLEHHDNQYTFLQKIQMEFDVRSIFL